MLVVRSEAELEGGITSAFVVSVLAKVDWDPFTGWTSGLEPFAKSPPDFTDSAARESLATGPVDSSIGSPLGALELTTVDMIVM